ncbi:Short-chain dehydrogenase/reductase family protein [Mycena venus]|uniref:Short-chain dehydrogenase/reductase family protein n=1 Tax=Mycena venus TaxID=2733690 RepID=A0A8H7CNF0_9AGAR|nr:Short-chain dehydrogenase/reductase family protein [Mycena venus]
MSLPTFTFSTTAEEVADVFADQIRGKNVLITGTSINGIGLEAARVLAKYANLVIITGYNSERLRLSEEAVKKEAAVEVNAYPEPLHVLINNAAAAVGEFKLTEDDLETQMATDHISPFLLTKLLAPKLLSAGSASYIPRVVNVSSDTQALGSGVNLNTVAHPDPEKYSMFDAYCQAKSANVLFAIELSKRSEGKINAYSLHPGTIFTNIMKKKETEATLIAGGVLTTDGRPNADQMKWKTLAQGAATTVAAAFDPRLESKPGAFLWDSVEANDKIAPHNSDPETAVKLWIITEGIIGEPFTF